MIIDELYQLYLQYPEIETDTRKLKPGTIFFALKGPNYDGNHYIQQALDAGAAYCITDEEVIDHNEKIIKVDDSLLALQQLAKKHRQQFDIPFLAITGSNGKTTTKELIHEVLSTSFKTYTTYGNLNNHIGIPTTILRIKRDAQLAVIEMGANHLKEIEGYCEYTMPTHGLITNCGKAHLEGFGGWEGVLKGKTELYSYLERNNGTVFINTNYEYLKPFAENIKNIVSYGTSSASYIGEVKDDNEFLEVAITSGADLPSIKTQLVGGYNLPNVLASVAVGKVFQVKEENIKKALENYTPSNSRSQLTHVGTNKIIMDAYNANPSSMQLAIRNIAHMQGENKVLVLGSMMELGPDSDKEHDEIIQLIQDFSWEAVALTGNGYKNIPADFFYFANSAEAAKWFRSSDFQQAIILIKGSRSMQMEKVLQ
ncbi:MAG: UDP-N-acetylmuramoyl-tripeptide--D-alanyl-D-alanine ligase [Ferruginibacter sp.]